MSAPRVVDESGAEITPDLILRAYLARCFPMAEHRHGPIAWYRPARRSIITFDRFHVPRSLAKVARQAPFRLSTDEAFPAVIAGCADRRTTWISAGLEQLYIELHRQGHAHSIEAWDGEELVGGLYGLAIGGCFCGESMFHRRPEASKLCVLELVRVLKDHDFRLIDCQQQTAHMARFGARLVSDRDYAQLLAECPERRRWG
jgi:leucyl/phenylalanyl-tRNA---protein transferase